MSPGSPFGAHTFKIGTVPQTKLALHVLAVPVHLFDVDGLYCQAMASLGATCLKYPAAILGFHTLTKAMYAHSTALLWLPGSLDHDLNNPPHKQQAATARRSA